ncbi:NAD(P)/FAD-dependent oxidoreductase [Paenibacillus sinopodophylli]|uniref:NAD(P)/FAD-dependent oxidoreductase n=1 Tax=Paenibacillus sinopodophylli TaxID=1837342 RepID=UPI00110CA92D|nr:FAD-dependent oxidoreductase [Paenibacillus sinopodophylli]
MNGCSLQWQVQELPLRIIAIEAVTIAPVDAEGRLTEEVLWLEVDAVIINHGMLGEFGPIADWGLEMGKWNIPVDDRMATNFPGIFVAGDTAGYSKKLHLIAGAFTDAALAVNGAKLYMDPKASTTAYVSSHNAKFNEQNKALRIIEENV